MSWQKDLNPFSLFLEMGGKEATELVKNVTILFIKELEKIKKLYPRCGMSDTAARESIANVVSHEIYEYL